MELQAGTRLQSVACESQVVVIRAPEGDVDLRCGGHPMVALGQDHSRRAVLAEHGEGTAIGKRYGDEELGVEVLCTKPGAGSLALGDRRLPLKGAKPLPSSD